MGLDLFLQLLLQGIDFFLVSFSGIGREIGDIPFQNLSLGAGDQGFLEDLFRSFAFDHLAGAGARALEDEEIKRVNWFGAIRRRVEVPNVGEIKSQDGDQDEDAAQEGIQEEFDGGIFAARSAPDADEKVHWQQHQFPKDVKEEEIQGQKSSDHARFQEQKQNAIAADVLG